MQASPTATLLVVEDDAKLRSVLERTLTFEGYKVTSCSDGVDGLEALTGRTFDAVIMDVSMPYLDGVGLCRRMRERGHAEPVLFAAVEQPQESWTPRSMQSIARCWHFADEGRTANPTYSRSCVPPNRIVRS